MKLIKGQLKHFWNKGYIAGFISRQDVGYVLTHKCAHRCILLRFCDSQLGSISCSYRREGARTIHAVPSKLMNADGIVEHLNPYTSDDLVQKKLSLDVRIDPRHNQILTGIQYIYPQYPLTGMLHDCAKARAHKWGPLGYTRTMVIITHDNHT
jgi:hypothetical protein